MKTDCHAFVAALPAAGPQRGHQRLAFVGGEYEGALSQHGTLGDSNEDV